MGSGIKGVGLVGASSLEGNKPEASSAPAPQSVSPEYEKMLQDGYLTATVGLGFYSTPKSDVHENAVQTAKSRDRIIDGLLDRGFKQVDARDLAKKVPRSISIDEHAKYFMKELARS